MKKNYTILAIETSLDDTCAAVTQDNRVLSNVVASQVKEHEEWGGTVPQIAKELHIKWIDKVVEKAMLDAGIRKNSIDAIAVTYGPGLAPSLEVGIMKAKELAQAWGKPLIGVNHMEGHLLSSLAHNSKGNGALNEEDMEYPVLGFLISGGHTQLVLTKSIGEYVLLGETLDDAAGEAYDKVARMLKLGYPGGPILAEMAKQGEPKYELPEPMKHRQDLNFSFSGLKTASLYKLKQMGMLDEEKPATREFVADFAASFQKAVLKMLTRRLKKAIKMYEPKMVLLGGGVVSNVEIRNGARRVAREYALKTYIPYSKKLIADNAAMIGVTAWYKARRGEFVEGVDKLDRVPNLGFNDNYGL